MRPFINLFQKKASFKPEPGMVLEIEWSHGAQDIVLYAKVREVLKKMLRVHCTQPAPSTLSPGCKVRVCSLSHPWFHSYSAAVYSNQDDFLELSLPGQELESCQVPAFRDEEKLQFATPVDYQASRSPYKQAAEVVAIGRRGLTLQTNVSIPNQTCLELNLKLPNRTEPIPAQVRALKSQTMNECKKYNTEVEFLTIPEPEREALWDVALRHHLRVKTRDRTP